MFKKKYQALATFPKNRYKCKISNNFLESMDVELQYNSIGLLQQMSVTLIPTNKELEEHNWEITPKKFDSYKDLLRILSNIEKNGIRRLKKEEEILELKKRQLTLFNDN